MKNIVPTDNNRQSKARVDRPPPREEVFSIFSCRLNGWMDLVAIFITVSAKDDGLISLCSIYYFFGGGWGGVHAELLGAWRTVDMIVAPHACSEAT